MNPDDNQSKANTEPDEPNLLLVEVDGLIASAEERIEQQRRYLHAVASNFDASMKGISKLETMMSALVKLKAYRARVAEAGGAYDAQSAPLRSFGSVPNKSSLR
jgi:hypothetical protein